jgi:hypothetical protein
LEGGHAETSRITLWVCFLLAVGGAGAGLAGFPQIMFASVGLAILGVFPLLYFVTKAPKAVGSVTLRLTQTGDVALGVVRGGLAAVSWVATDDPVLTPPLYGGGSGDPDSLVGAIVVGVVAAVVERSTAKARSVTAPLPPAGAEASLLCHPPKPRLGIAGVIVRVSLATDAWGSNVTLAGASLGRDPRLVQEALRQLQVAIVAAGRSGVIGLAPPRPARPVPSQPHAPNQPNTPSQPPAPAPPASPSRNRPIRSEPEERRRRP